MNCEICESTKEKLAIAVKAEVSADDDLRVAVIRADGSSTEMHRKLDDATLRRAAITHELVEHRQSH